MQKIIQCKKFLLVCFLQNIENTSIRIHPTSKCAYLQKGLELRMSGQRKFWS